MLDTALPDLILHGLPLGPKQDSIDLRWLLYNGAASTYGRTLKKVVESGRLGRPLLERLPLLQAIHGHWQAGIATGTVGNESAKMLWGRLRNFVAFTEKAKKPLTLAGALNFYLVYCAYIKRRSDLSAMTHYKYSNELALLIAPVLGMDTRKLQWKTKIRMPKRLGNRSAKENLHGTANFVQTLLETVEQLPVDVIRGPLPVILRYAAGGEHAIHLGLPLQPLDSLRLECAYKYKRAVNARERRASNISNKARSKLINLRLEAELLIFVNQTGSNLTQALQLTGSQFRYQSDVVTQ